MNGEMTTDQADLPSNGGSQEQDEVIKLAIMAVGGQGGSVLTNWIEDCARSSGYCSQATSVAGVAQRTGATIYYIEMAPASDGQPVFSLMPAAGDVDILVAAEMMEAGRAILRGFVTPDRTTLIASSHRALAVSEKTVPGDGMASSSEVLAAAQIAARRFIHFDMERIASANRTVISASLLGALAGSRTLPFSRQQFEAAIKKSRRGVEESLAAFGEAFDRASGATDAPASIPAGALRQATRQIAVPKHLEKPWKELTARLDALPEEVRQMAKDGLARVVDFQDLSYGDEYLSKLENVLTRDNSIHEYRLTHQVAKYLARAMAYDDIIHVADLKTRASRFARVRHEMKQPDDTRMKLTEFMHPRAEELVSMLPAKLGRRLSASTASMTLIDRLFNRGRRMRSDRLLPFLQLYTIAGLRRWRRKTLRHHTEKAQISAWLENALKFVDSDYDYAVELIRNRRLIKGYSDTHARGLSKFDQVNEGAMLVAGRADAASWVRRLREAALLDEEGAALKGALKTVQSFSAETAQP